MIPPRNSAIVFPAADRGRRPPRRGLGVGRGEVAARDFATIVHDPGCGAWPKLAHELPRGWRDRASPIADPHVGDARDRVGREDRLLRPRTIGGPARRLGLRPLLRERPPRALELDLLGRRGAWGWRRGQSASGLLRRGPALSPAAFRPRRRTARASLAPPWRAAKRLCAAANPTDSGQLSWIRVQRVQQAPPERRRLPPAARAPFEREQASPQTSAASGVVSATKSAWRNVRSHVSPKDALDETDAAPEA